MPIALNQFLHASAPIRVVLALLANLKWLMTSGAQNATVYTKRNALLGVLLYDGLGGLLLGWYLGTLGGKVAGSSTRSVVCRRADFQLNSAVHPNCLPRSMHLHSNPLRPPHDVFTMCDPDGGEHTTACAGLL
ncbi:hypothetical protein B0H16DRAFT_775925 [Mycena metata]|uniref:Uncharacterized protein n=1 Tax=Mycena metata TaxID=1033252 RepID=A0AAD7J0B0_9AGAR|nr:hypothetical protein B0H16DRAFT_775925 [Mycena metata]